MGKEIELIAQDIIANGIDRGVYDRNEKKHSHRL
jgi:hypothetical protein